MSTKLKIQRTLFLMAILLCEWSFSFSQSNETIRLGSFSVPPNLSSREIIKAVEDTIGVDVRELDEGRIDDVIQRARDIAGEETPNRPGEDINTQEKQEFSDKVLDQVQDASQKIEKLIETASEELRQNVQKVEVFGFDFLQNREIKLFNSALDIKPPENYVIGSGDELNIVVWGYADYNEVFTVDEKGYIQPRLVGRIYIKGLTYKNAKEVIRQRFGQAYNLRNSQLDITLNYSRVITVNVVGEVFNPGSFTVPAINTAFNILSFVGGPNEIGSIRNIQIKRGNDVVQRFDLYKFMFEPEKQEGVFLENNDYIYVPRAQKTIEISGEIKRPGKFELLENEGLNELLKYSAGFTPAAYTRNIQIKRYLNNKIYLIDIDLEKRNGQNFQLFDGDEIYVRKVPELLKNYVNIEGAVNIPGRYVFSEGLTVLKLIENAAGFKDDVYLEEAYLTRTFGDFTKKTFKLNLAEVLENPSSDQNMALKERDHIEIFSKTYFYDKFNVSISGAVRNPRSFELQEGMTLRDIILLAGGLEQHAYQSRAFITRTNPYDKRTSYLTVMLDTSNNMGALDTIKILENDQVEVLSNLTFLNESRVEIQGAVRHPGIFELWRELSLRDLILLAGGLNESVYLDRAYIFREKDELNRRIIPIPLDPSNNFANLDTVYLERRDIVKIFSKTEFLESYLVEVNGEVKKPDVFDFTFGMTLADALMLSGGFKFISANNRIEIARIEDFVEAVTNDIPLSTVIETVSVGVDIATDSLANAYKLQPFDQIYVRAAPGFDLQEKVYIYGEVQYPGVYPLQNKNETLSSLIERAGGLTEYSFARGTTLFREEENYGKVVMNLEKALRRNHSKYNYVLKEGDRINVPRTKDLVTIAGKIRYPYTDRDSTINAPYTNNKRARFYIRNYGTGFAKGAKKRDTYVVHSGGLVRGTKTFWGAKFYPRVDKGSSIYVPPKPPKREKRERKQRTGEFDPLKFTQSFLATTTSAVTLFLLIKSLD